MKQMITESGIHIRLDMVKYSKLGDKLTKIIQELGDVIAEMEAIDEAEDIANEAGDTERESSGTGLFPSKRIAPSRITFPEGSEEKLMYMYYFNIQHPTMTTKLDNQLQKVLEQGMEEDDYFKFIERGMRVEKDKKAIPRTITRVKTGLTDLKDTAENNIRNFVEGKGVKRKLVKGSPEAKAFMKSLRDKRKN
jgi:hypothetical protein